MARGRIYVPEHLVRCGLLQTTGALATTKIVCGGQMTLVDAARRAERIDQAGRGWGEWHEPHPQLRIVDGELSSARVESDPHGMQANQCRFCRSLATCS